MHMYIYPNQVLLPGLRGRWLVRGQLGVFNWVGMVTYSPREQRSYHVGTRREEYRASG